MPKPTETSCPPWCDERHPNDPVHFATFLDRELPDRAGTPQRDLQVIVAIRDHLPEDEYDNALGPVFIELELPANSGCVDLTWLTPDEASQIGLGLIAAAAKAAGRC